MKRSLKNVITAVLIILVCAATVVTMGFAKNSTSSAASDNNTGTSQSASADSGAGGASGDASADGTASAGSDTSADSTSDGSAGTDSAAASDSTADSASAGSSDSSAQSTDSQTPPEKPDGDTSGTSGSSSEPPAKPDGDSSGSTGTGTGDAGASGGDTASANPSGSTDAGSTGSSDTAAGDTSSASGDSSSSSQPPELPSGDSGSGQMGGDQPGGMAGESETKLATIYYVLFCAEGLALAALILYLILSQANKKTFKETFKNADKITIYVLAVIVAAEVFAASFTVVTQKVLLASDIDSSQGMGQGSGSSVTYSAVTEITEDTEVDGETYESSTADENAVLVSGDIDVTMTGITVSKTGDSDGGDNTSFYGNNSAVLAKDGANLTITNATITTDAAGANGVFSYGGSATTDNSSSDGTTVNISNSTITTTKDNSGGIMTTGGGVMNATNLTVNTAGTSSAAIRTDRGGGTVTVDQGTYTTTGQGSPAVYSTADITVKNATLISEASEGVCIEGKNSVTLENCTLTDSNTKLNGQSTTYKNIFLYQSMSGDADTGEAEFTAKNCKITTNNGDTLYVTNTTASFTLENNTIVNNDADGNFLRAQADSWGNEGSNGGNVILNMINQSATGNIVIDSISTLEMTMTDGSYYEGTINGSNEAKSISLKLDSDSKIKLTGDSYVTSLEDEDTTYSNIDFNGYTLYVNGTAING